MPRKKMTCNFPAKKITEKLDFLFYCEKFNFLNNKIFEIHKKIVPHEK